MENYIKSIVNLSVDKSKSNVTKLNQKVKSLSKLKEVAEEFESIFVNMLLKEMRKTVDKTDFLHGGMVEDIFEDMLYTEYSKKIAKDMNLGIAKKVVELYKDYI